MAAAVIAALVLAPLAVYALLVGALSNGVATWTTALLRPVSIMLLLTPTLIGGHGVAIVPLGLALGSAVFTDEPYAGSALNESLLQWLVMSVLAFLFEVALAAWRRRRLRRLTPGPGGPDAARALRMLTGGK